MPDRAQKFQEAGLVAGRFGAAGAGCGDQPPAAFDRQQRRRPAGPSGGHVGLHRDQRPPVGGGLLGFEDSGRIREPRVNGLLPYPVGTPAAEQNTAGRLFLVLSLVAVIGVAAVLIALGAEGLGRHHRAAVRQALLALEDNRSQLAELRFQLAPLHAELEAIKEAIANLPNYGAGCSTA
jgi:hypothetical protein